MAGISIKPIGVDRAVARLNGELAAIGQATLRGLVKGGLRIMRRSMQLAPVDTSNLRASAYLITNKGTVMGGGGDRASADQALAESSAILARQKGPSIIVGHSAAYSFWVHEVQAKHNPPTQWKFLEKAVTDESAAVVDDVAGEIRI